MNGARAASKHEPHALGLGEEGASGGVRMWWGALTHLQTLGGVCELEQGGQGQRRVGLVRAGAAPLGADGQVSLHPVWV